MRSSRRVESIRSPALTDPFRLALVVPRFGEQVWGGAELHGRWLAEHLAARGHSVDIYTTCAIDHRSWRNELEPGVETHGPLRVHRFPTTERDLGIHGELDRAVQAGFTLSREEELLWLRHGGSSVEMEEELERTSDSYDAVLALPYIFGTTYFTYATCPDKTVLIPCLHDEPFAYLDFVREMLNGARGVMFNTMAEVRLAERLAGSLAPWGVVGVGFDPHAPARPRRRKRRLPEPSLLYVGRRETGKNSPLLIDYFCMYKNRRPGDLVLAFIGSGDRLPPRRDIIEVQTDWSSHDEVYRPATIFCLPSVNESLSIVLLQAWLSERPALVHGACAVTREHCERSNGGLWFNTYAEFEEAVDRMLASEPLRAALGRNGHAYVRREYSWEAVLGRLEESLTRFLGSAAKADLGSSVG
jgi:glycosyltransferase involved in cell wall biosynthesis